MTATKKETQITVAQARRARRCECNRGVVCRGSGDLACGVSAWDNRFCEGCQYGGCGQPAVERSRDSLRPVPNCGHVAADGGCAHPANPTPECAYYCPLIHDHRPVLEMLGALAARLEAVPA